MKKLIAISVMLVLLVGAAFAQPSVGGNWKGKFNFLGGVSPSDDGYVWNEWAGPIDKAINMAGNGEVGDAVVNVSWSGDNAGGMIRLYMGSANDTGYQPLFTYVWWQPLDVLKVHLGRNPDGYWGKANITGWGFNSEAQSGVALDNDTGVGCEYAARIMGPAKIARETGFYGGFNGGSRGNFVGLGFEIKPADILQVNLGFDGGAKVGENGIRDYYLDETHLNIVVPLDVGTISIATILNGFYGDDKLVMPDLYASFYLSAIDDIGVDIGFAMKPAFIDGDSTYDIVEAGLGFSGNFGDVGFKLRAGMEMGLDSGNMGVGVQILPSYNAGSFKFFFNAGFGMYLYDGVDDTPIEWYVNPYLRVPVNQGEFMVGFQLKGESNITWRGTNGVGGIAWAVPISWNVYF